jgi:glycosyltransferase involved in cell wall biosynthesis
MTGNRTVASLRRLLWRERIARMGVVDREYAGILAGRTFATDRSAIDFYLRNAHDAALGLALSPLIEKDWIARQIAETDPGWTASWYATLLTRPGTFSTSPFFDPAVYRPAEAATGLTTLQALRRFLADATPATVMPVSPVRSGTTPLTWAQCREQALTDARLFAYQLHLRRPRTTLTWDETAERAFLASLRDGGPATEAARAASVSVIMPTFNRLDTLRAAVASVQAQTHTAWELFVVDDGSTDGTAAYLWEVAALDGRIRPIEQASAGVSAARNRGLAAATGEVIAFLDSDNTWRPHFLEYSLAGMRAHGASAVHCGVRLRRDDDVIRYRGIDGSRDDLLYAGNFLDLNSIVLTRALLDTVDGFDESIKRWVDYDLFLAVSRTETPVYLPFLGVDYDDHTSPGRITGSESASWEDVVVGKHLIDWNALAAAAGERHPGMVSVVIPTFTDWRMTADAVRAVLAHSGSRPLDVIVIENGSRRHVYALLRALFGGEPRVSVVRMPRNLNFALANNYAISLSQGEYVVALNNDTEVTAGWLEPLLAPLLAPPEESAAVLGTQPLLLYPDGTVQAAGTVFLGDGTLPQHFLAGRPAADARAVTRTDYAAVTAAALCMRADDLVALHGFDPLFTNGLEDVDLCLRTRQLRPGAFRVVSDSVVVHFESKTPGRARFVTRNRELFLSRWTGNYPPDDQWRLDALAPVAATLADPEASRS